MQQLTGRNDMTKDGQFVKEAHDIQGPAPGFEGSNFLVAPKLNQKEVYDKVHAVLHAGGSVGIFPEGGSHDRTDLLPLKGENWLFNIIVCVADIMQLVLLSWHSEP
jgi:glycerol-3-phosphate O-acyltransferase/dihydroxyacetone phosphate acyltransferase